MKIRCLVVILAAAGALLADGGKMQFRKQAGPFVITLFSSPEQPRVGNTDLSVMLQKAAGQSTILDAEMKLHLIKTETGTITEIMVPATHARATNKLLYAAAVKLPSAGRWRIEVLVNEGGNSAEVSGNLNVLPPQAPLAIYWPYFALVPLVALLFAANQWLRRNRRVRP